MLNCVSLLPRSLVTRSARAPPGLLPPVWITIVRRIFFALRDGRRLARASALVDRLEGLFRLGGLLGLAAYSAVIRGADPRSRVRGATNKIGQPRSSNTRQGRPASVTVAVKRSPLAGAATSPGPAATSAAATAAAGSPAASATTTAATASTAAASATPGKFFAYARCRGVFLVEDVERRQADVGNLLLTEKDFVMRQGILRRYVRRRSAGRRGCSTRQRQRHPGYSQHGYGFPPTVPFRSLLRTRHLESSHTFGQCPIDWME